MTYQMPLMSQVKTRAPAKPDDHLAVVVYWIIALTGAALACRIHLAYATSVRVHLLVALPPVLIACVMPMRLLQGWLSRGHEEAKRPLTVHSK
jgi:uncharacterized protein (DUF983 family)